MSKLAVRPTEIPVQLILWFFWGGGGCTITNTAATANDDDDNDDLDSEAEEPLNQIVRMHQHNANSAMLQTAKASRENYGEEQDNCMRNWRHHRIEYSG